MKTTLLGIGIAVSLFSTTAFAGDHRHHGRDRHHDRDRRHDHGWYQRDTGDNCGYQGPHRHERNGRYELQSVQKWVPGSYQNVWVPHQCSGSHFGRRCHGGYYTQQWQQGYYTTVQEWVFVPQVRSYPRFGVSAVEYPAAVTVSASTPYVGVHFSSGF